MVKTGSDNLRQVATVDDNFRQFATSSESWRQIARVCDLKETRPYNASFPGVRTIVSIEAKSPQHDWLIADRPIYRRRHPSSRGDHMNITTNSRDDHMILVVIRTLL